MDPIIEALRTEFATLHTEAGAFVTKAATGEVTPEEQTANANRYARMDKIKLALDADKKRAEYAFTAGNVETPKEPEGKKQFEHEIKVTDRFDATKIDRQEFGRACSAWAHTGNIINKYATITTATQSSLFLPKSVMTPFVGAAKNAFREGYAAWGVDVMDTEGDASQFSLPVVDATQGGQVAENASSETDGTPTLSESIISTVKTYQSGTVYYSNLQLMATKFDLLAATIPAVSYGKELGLESTIVAAMIADAGITQTVPTATVTGFTFANLVSLNNKLPKRYQINKVIMLSQAAYTAAEGLTDTVGRPVMIADTQNQNLKRIGGTPCVRSDYFQAFGANNIVGAIFSLPGFHLRDAGEGITRYNQLPAKPSQTGINLFGFHAYGYAPSAVATLKCPAS